MSTGERKRVSSTRRGGMTVLGKVAVPKPINLPSQKLENHGMDPNVEIVPKGTLSWGNRSSSPASNAWGSSPLSLHTDNGRPSSGGSGTRPSTGGSEKAYESASSAWGSNSRPSSASGALTSIQGSGTTLRPHSADTRPGSSQLSRFAEPSTENSGTWAAAGSGDNSAHSKNEKFSLASGDFPTLGSEKEDPPKNSHSSPHGDDAVADVRINSENVNHGRRESPPYEEGRRPNMEKWHGDAKQQNLNMPGPPQHFAPWHGAPAGSPPVGVWFRGPPGAPYVPPGGAPYGPPGAPPYGPSGGPPYGPSGIPPYGPLIGPGGFPVEHPYYHPPMPAPPHGNSQPVPHHGAGPRGLHQNNGEMYRPHMADGHFRPGMPMRPGFFPGPMPYEGYYPPPMGYCGPNDRDIPYMGPAGGPAIHDRHLNPNANDLVNSQPASGAQGSNEKLPGPEQVASGHRHNPREQYKVLLKQQGDNHQWGDSTAANDSQFEKGYLPRPSSYGKDQNAGSYSGEKTESRRTPIIEGGPIRGTHGHGGSQFHGRERLAEEAKSVKEVRNAERNLEDEVLSSEVAPKDSGLIKKIEGLNAKTRGSDGKQDVALKSSWDEGRSRSHTISNTPHSTFPANNTSIGHGKSHGGGIINPPNAHGTEAGGGPNSFRTYANSGPQVRTDYRGKGKADFLETDGRHKKIHNGHFSTAVSSSTSESVIPEVQDHRSNMGVRKPESSLEGKDVILDSASISDPIDVEAQRAKKREIAKQRAIQLQREEEERIKEQKAKAQAKLEELNRRTKLTESSTKGHIVTEKAEMDSSSGEADHNQEALPKQPINVAVAEKSAPSSEINPLKPNSVSSGTKKLEHQLQVSKDDLPDRVISHHQSPAEQEGGHHKIDARGEPQHYGGKNNAFKSKSKGYKEKQNILPEKVATEKIIKASGDTLQYGTEVGEQVTKNVTVLAEHVVPQRTKGNKSGKNKHKVEDTSASVVIRSATPRSADIMKAPSDSSKLQSPKLAEPSHVLPPVISWDETQSTESHAFQLKEETQSRTINHSRYQGSRKQSRNQQGNRTSDKSHGSDTVIWAPVRQPNKEAIDDSCLKVVSEEADHMGKTDHALINIKNKRAEIERYVPKPVAKELAHQGGAQQPTSPPTNLMDSSGTKVETAIDNKSGDNNYNKRAQARAPGAWRQRVSGESSDRQGPEDGSLGYPVVSKGIHKPADQTHVVNADSHETREKKNFSDGWNSHDDWDANTYKVPDASVPLRDQGSFNRGKPNHNRGSRNTKPYVHDREHGKGQTGKDVDIGHSHLEVSNSDEQDRAALRREPRLEGGHPSHLQTKSHDLSAGNQQASRLVIAGQNSSGETSRFVKKEHAPHKDHIQPKNVKVTDGESNRHNAPAKSGTGSFANTDLQHDKRERKMAIPQVGSFSSNPNSRAQVEQPPPVEYQHERPHSSSGMRKNGNQNNRNLRGQEYQGEWNSIEPDRRYHNQPSGRGRPRHNNSHYEYKPKGQSLTADTDGANLH
ncbi:unnamed protein product [Rhodiola kirilowii]